MNNFQIPILQSTTTRNHGVALIIEKIKFSYSPITRCSQGAF